MAKYITSDGNDWDELLSDDFNIVNEMHSHDIFYVISIINTRYLYDTILKNEGEDVEVYVDLIFESLYNKNECSEMQWVGTAYLLKYLLTNGYSGILVQASDSIENDSIIIELLRNGSMTNVKFKSVTYEFDGVEEDYGMETTIKFKDGHVVQVISTSKRLVFSKLLKLI